MQGGWRGASREYPPATGDRLVEHAISQALPPSAFCLRNDALRHTIAPREPPVVNRGLVAANVIIFLIQLFAGPSAEALIGIFGFQPARLFDPAAFH